MVFIYDIGLMLYGWLLRLAALWHPKARLWVEGRAHVFSSIEKAAAAWPKDQPIVWVHVASLGEFEQGRPIIEALKSDLNQKYTLVLTFFSPSGYEMRKNYAHADAVFYMPLDSRQHAKRFLDLIRPQAAVFIKYEFWYHYLSALHERHIPTFLVSAVFRERQFAPFNPYGRLLRRTLHCFSHIFVQNTVSEHLLKQQGLTHISQTGDTRIDRVLAIAAEARLFTAVAEFAGTHKILIGGSTWPQDIDLIRTWWSETAPSGWRLIIAPHEIGAENIRHIEQNFPNQTLRYSQLATPTDASVLIIDNIGLLSALYRYATVAYIGGGFGKGIHNTLEPVAFGKPVVFGPKHHKFEEAQQLIAKGGGFCVRNSHDFINTMTQLSQKAPYDKAAAAAHHYVEEQKGATQKVVPIIKKYL